MAFNPQTRFAELQSGLRDFIFIVAVNIDAALISHLLEVPGVRLLADEAAPDFTESH